MASVVINETAYQLIQNGSIVKGSYTVYTGLIGQWFWVILLMFMLIAVYIRTEDSTYIFVYGMIGLLSLSSFYLLPVFFKPFIYIMLSIALLITLYAFFVRKG